MRSEQRDAHQVALGVIILAAGASSRMGRPKLLLPWGGTSVVGHLIAQWHSLGAAQVAVVGREGDESLHKELDRLRFPQTGRIVNPQPERGMFSSILCAANWIGWRTGLNAWALVLGDQPHLRDSTLRALLAFYLEHRRSICQPDYAGRARHPVILPKDAFAALSRSRAGTLREFLERSSDVSNKCSIDDPGLVLDLDRPEDYRNAQNIFTSNTCHPT